MSDIRALCAAVYEATEAWTFGSTSAPVTAAEQALRDALDATPPVPDECPVVAAARTVHALGGFHFDARVDREPESIGVAEAEWGRLMRTLPATSSENT